MITQEWQTRRVDNVPKVQEQYFCFILGHLSVYLFYAFIYVQMSDVIIEICKDRIVVKNKMNYFGI
jgi:hypothetical protein